VPEVAHLFCGMREADSVAVDPHKWLYTPLEAGCVLVRDPNALRQTFSYHPPYYHFDEKVINYFDLGPQNSRGFRALKVWLALRQVGRSGYVRMIGDDIRLAQEMSRLVARQSDLEALTQGLSITTFRYVPEDLRGRLGVEEVEQYLNELNQKLLNQLERNGEVFLSNALVSGRFALRACIVNFRTSLEDIEALPGIISRVGHEVDVTLRHRMLQTDDHGN
jgi:aromatic-L-amino-acid decarboxylase